jgi:arylsulfatase
MDPEREEKTMSANDKASKQDYLPFPPTPSASIAGRTMQESVYKRRVEPRRLPADSPNILIVLIDDAGPGLPSTLGGEVQTPTMDRVAMRGISLNRFHTTAMCSPTRASILTGRNHHRVGNGQITELANDWDGYSGHIPRSSALVAEVLKDYGYSTGAWGKWHNTPAEETTAAGPCAEHHGRSAAQEPGGGLPSQRRPGGGRHRLASDTQDLTAGQAVLYVLGKRRAPRPAPHHEGMGR